MIDKRTQRELDHVNRLRARLSAAEDGAKDVARHHAFVLTQVTGQLKRVEEENAELRRAYESDEEAIKQAAEVVQLREENERLTLSVQARDAIIDHESASGPSGEIARLQARLSAAEEARDDCDREQVELAERLAAANRVWQAQEIALKRAEAENEELRRAYESDEEAINQAAEVVRLREENERLREENKRLFGETVSLEQGLENINAELIIEQQDNERLKREVVDPAKTLGAGAYYRQDFVDDLQSRLSEAEAQRNEAEKRVGHWMGKAKRTEAVVEAAKSLEREVSGVPFEDLVAAVGVTNANVIASKRQQAHDAIRRYEEGK